MGAGYQVAYRLGLTPWERAGREGEEQFGRLLDRESVDRPSPPGVALDLGCGTGIHTIELAQRGWRAIGIDNVRRALDHAGRRTVDQETKDRVEFVRGDVTDLAAAGVSGPVDFFLDIGCFHGLTDDQRAAMGASVAEVSTPGATMLVLAFVNGRRVGLPRGASVADIERAHPSWQVIATEAADTSGMPGPLKRTAPQFHRLARRS
ncbi:hypothetical protein ASG90_17560 [Nocardioides sp. Soil797]|nr:hypothetical protein ASG90_17560 [Nocardioides sp. Soil797]